MVWQEHLGGSMDGGSPKCLVYQGKSHVEIDDDWGYPHFRKPPNTCDLDVAMDTTLKRGPFWAKLIWLFFLRFVGGLPVSGPEIIVCPSFSPRMWP